MTQGGKAPRLGMMQLLLRAAGRRREGTRPMCLFRQMLPSHRRTQRRAHKRAPSASSPAPDSQRQPSPPPALLPQAIQHPARPPPPPPPGPHSPFSLLFPFFPAQPSHRQKKGKQASSTTIITAAGFFTVDGDHHCTCLTVSIHIP